MEEEEVEEKYGKERHSLGRRQSVPEHRQPWKELWPVEDAL